MPSKSKAQQRFFGMVDAYKKGEMKNPSSKIKKAAKGMSMSDVKDFAETKHKGLPEKVKENMEKKVIRMTESDLHNLVKEAVNKILKESMNEVQFGGESLHGNNPEDWAAAMHMRDANVNRDERLAKSRFYKNNNSASLSGIHNREQGLKDLKNMVQTNHNTLEPFGAANDKGREKAKRIIANRNKEEMNKQFGGGW